MDPTPLTAELTAVRGELPRVDAKCSTLAGLDMAGIGFAATQVTHGPLAARALMAAAGAVLAVATLILLMQVLRPRLGDTGFRMWARMTPAEIRAAFADPAAVTGHMEGDLVVLSQITDRKYRGLRTAVELTAAAVGLAAVAIVAGVLS